MDQELSRILSTAGFPRNEIRVYIALVRLGESKVSAIIKHLNFRSGKIYDVLNSLKKKGLIAETIKNNIKHYTAMPPTKIKEYLKTKQIELEEQEEHLQKIMPQLDQFYTRKDEKTIIKVFEGVEGIKTATYYQHEKAEPGSKLYSYGLSGKRKKAINLMWAKTVRISRQKNLDCHLVITDESKESKQVVKQIVKSGNYKVRFEKGSYDANFVLTENMVILYHYDKENCILIEDKDYANTFKELFLKIWAKAKK